MTDTRHHNHGRPKGTEEEGFEHQDLGMAPIIGFIISVVLTGLVVYYGSWAMFRFLDAYGKKGEHPISPMVQAAPNTRDMKPSDVKATLDKIPGPLLEDDERTELNDVRYGEEEELNSYGWVDQSGGVAHIPITRAMQLIAERGLPTAPQAGTTPPSVVNTAKQAAAKSDTSNATKKQKGKSN